MTQTTRRTLVRGAAWTAPVIAVAAAAPAFAASQPITCAPTAECKQPGEGSNTKDYVVRLNCTSTTPITKVEVFDNKEKVWISASPNGDGTWTAPGFNDSRRDRLVRLTDKYGQEQTYTVAFPPC
jgi:hypothetical protein